MCRCLSVSLSVLSMTDRYTYADDCCFTVLIFSVYVLDLFHCVCVCVCLYVCLCSCVCECDRCLWDNNKNRVFELQLFPSFRQQSNYYHTYHVKSSHYCTFANTRQKRLIIDSFVRIWYRMVRWWIKFSIQFKSNDEPPLLIGGWSLLRWWWWYEIRTTLYYC